MKEVRERLVKIAQDPAQYKPLLEGLIAQVLVSFLPTTNSLHI